VVLPWKMLQVFLYLEQRTINITQKHQPRYHTENEMGFKTETKNDSKVKQIELS
jgi:hypothetical protein